MKMSETQPGQVAKQYGGNTRPKINHAERVEKIIKKEKPCAILPTMGGQTALNTAISMEKKGILKKNKVELIGAKAKAISRAEEKCNKHAMLGPSTFE